MNILFVCLGNICRSPIADGVMRDLVKKASLNWNIDSAGTSNYHIGEAPDKRAQRISKEHQIDIGNLSARQFVVEDFDLFDYIFVMDAQNYADILRLCRNESDKLKIELFLNRLNPGMNKGVTDPWFNDELFSPVFLEIQETCQIIFEEMQRELSS